MKCYLLEVVRARFKRYSQLLNQSYPPWPTHKHNSIDTLRQGISYSHAVSVRYLFLVSTTTMKAFTAVATQTTRYQSSGSPYHAPTSPAQNTLKAEASQFYMACNKHLLLSSGIPFYPQGQLPQAPCPHCTKDHDDGINKVLYYVNGTSKSDCHPEIPDTAFQTLDLMKNGPGSETLRVRSERSDLGL